MSYTNGLDKPSDYFSTKLYTGTGSSHAVSGIGFSPSWVWIKDRGNATNQMLFDSVRGTGKELHSQNTDSETTQANTLTAFGSDGFSLGSNTDVNNSSQNFVSWNWKAGTSVSGTTTGSGTGKAYSGSVSTDAGFSIIKYIGNGTAGHQIPHHLNAVPKMFIVKRINASGGWVVYHENVGNTKIIELHDSAASQTSSAAWNNTSPSSTTFTLGDYTSTNTNDGIYISYCFAEKKGFSKFGSYTGNGNVDGTFVYTGFKPAMIVIKKNGAGDNWHIYDNKVNPTNVMDTNLRPNLSDAEITNANHNLDFVSNGFKWRTTSNTRQGSGSEVIYMAFAESPFVTSTGIPTTAR